MGVTHFKSLREVPKKYWNELISVQEAAEIRGVKPSGIWDLIRRDRLTCFVIANRKYVLRTEVVKFEALPPGPPKGTKKEQKKKKDE